MLLTDCQFFFSNRHIANKEAGWKHVVDGVSHCGNYAYSPLPPQEAPSGIQQCFLPFLGAHAVHVHKIILLRK